MLLQALDTLLQCLDPTDEADTAIRIDGPALVRVQLNPFLDPVDHRRSRS